MISLALEMCSYLVKYNSFSETLSQSSSNIWSGDTNSHLRYFPLNCITQNDNTSKAKRGSPIASGLAVFDPCANNHGALNFI